MATIENRLGVSEALAASPFDAIVAISPENVPYVSGCQIETQRSIRHRLALVLWPKGDDPSFVVCSIEESQAREESWIEDVRAYVEFQTTPIEVLARLLEERGLSRARVGIEIDYLSAAYFEELRRLSPETHFEDLGSFFPELRAVKTQEEIDQLEAAATATERALLATYMTIRCGESEHSMRSKLIANLTANGAEGIEFAYINAGGNSGYPHHQATDYRCAVGDTIKSDVGGTWSGYVSDIGRTGIVGPPTKKQREIWQKLEQVQEQTIDALRAGKTAANVFETMKREMGVVGLPFPLPHAGHSIGREVHEAPVLSPVHDTIIEANMVFAVESRVRWPGTEGYHLEDLVLVTESGPKVLTNRLVEETLWVV